MTKLRKSIVNTIHLEYAKSQATKKLHPQQKCIPLLIIKKTKGLPFYYLCFQHLYWMIFFFYYKTQVFLSKFKAAKIMMMLKIDFVFLLFQSQS